MKKILLATLAAAVLAASANAITYVVTYTGSASEISRPNDNPLGYLDSYDSFSLEIKTKSNVPIDENSIFAVDSWHWVELKIFDSNLVNVPTSIMFGDATGISNPQTVTQASRHDPSRVDSEWAWSWIATFDGNTITHTKTNPNRASYVWSGTVTSATSSVPDSNTTASLASFGLLALIAASRLCRRN